MNAALLQQIVQILIQAVELGIQYGPELFAEIKQLYELAVSGTDLTADQQASADATLAKADAVLTADLKNVEQADAVPNG